jgi:hypothetical protein
MPGTGQLGRHLALKLAFAQRQVLWQALRQRIVAVLQQAATHAIRMEFVCRDTVE